jgi:hypothetical protein
VEKKNNNAYPYGINPFATMYQKGHPPSSFDGNWNRTLLLFPNNNKKKEDKKTGPAGHST